MKTDPDILSSEMVFAFNCEQEGQAPAEPVPVFPCFLQEVGFLCVLCALCGETVFLLR